MDETLHQLGGLLLGSVPTIFLFLLLVILYRLLVYGPLTRVLNERRERTEGAIEQANAAMAAAAAKTQEYEAQLRAARSRIFQARQQKQQQWTRERDNAIAEAHAAAQRQVEEAKSALQAQTEAAHAHHRRLDRRTGQRDSLRHPPQKQCNCGESPLNFSRLSFFFSFSAVLWWRTLPPATASWALQVAAPGADSAKAGDSTASADEPRNWKPATIFIAIRAR